MPDENLVSEQSPDAMGPAKTEDAVSATVEPEVTPTESEKLPDTFEVSATPLQSPVVNKATTPIGHKYGGFWIRFLAIFIDGLIFSILVMPILKMIFPLAEGSKQLASNNATSVDSILALIYSVIMIVVFGATIGKMAVGLRIVKEDGSKLSIGDAIIREVVGKFVSAVILFIGFIMAAFDPRKQGLHDKIAHTFVVYKKS